MNFTHVEEQGQFISWMQYFGTGQETLKCWSLMVYNNALASFYFIQFLIQQKEAKRNLAVKIKRLRWFLRQLASSSFTFLFCLRSRREAGARAGKNLARKQIHHVIILISQFLFSFFNVAANFRKRSVFYLSC